MSAEERKNRFYACTAIAMMLILFTSTLVWGLDNITGSKPSIKKPVTPLPVVGDMENLKRLLNQTQDSSTMIYGSDGSDIRIMNQAIAPSAAKEFSKNESLSADSAAANYSSTNVQVEGVDEADIIKTDGQYIYQVNQQNINIIKAQPASKMELVSKLTFEDQNFSPQEIYLDSQHLVVIGSYLSEQLLPYENSMKIEIYPPAYRHVSKTRVMVYDISDKSNIKKTREIELDGNYLSSRKIGSAVYLVSNQNIPYYEIQNQDIPLPNYRDSSLGNSVNTINCDQIRYFPDCIYPAYILTAGFDLNNNQEKVDVKSYLGNGENIYASAGSLYVAIRQYRQQQPEVLKSKVSSTVMAPAAVNTTIYKFALAQGKVDYSGKGEVPGTILNQFSMDEDNGYFRIATTTGEVWRDDEYTSRNNLYVLDGELNITGQLENIAPREKIYSTRFMGDRAYMVTFKKVDPLFVIDLKDPQKPSLLGKLKIPGYSDYLHPYDETHLIGFGKESIELKTGRGDSQAFYQGMKIALFDVSDVNNPQQVAQTLIGDRGTDSELLHNHKALLFSKEQNLLAFPVTVMEVGSQSKVDEYGYPRYGSFTFQGAYVYNLDPVNGFNLKGRISHLDAADYQKSGDSWYDSEKNVERVIYIDKTLYTLSQGMIKANQTSDLKEVGSLPLQ